MKKKLFTFIFALLIVSALAVSGFADGVRCVDNACLLSDAEFASLTDKLDELSEKHRVDITVLTTFSTDGKSVYEYADDYYDQSGWGQGSSRDGILLVISMEDRDWYISTCGQGINAVTDYGISYIGNEIVSQLSEGDYSGAFERYAELCDTMLSQAENGKPYDVDNKIQEKHGFNFLGGVLSLIMGAVTAAFPTLAMKNNLKSVNNQVRASSYVRQGSLNLAQKSDSFVYRHIASVPIIRDDSNGGSSVHMSHGGMSHGGGGGKF